MRIEASSIGHVIVDEELGGIVAYIINEPDAKHLAGEHEDLWLMDFDPEDHEIDFLESVAVRELRAISTSRGIVVGFALPAFSKYPTCYSLHELRD